jgi:hypothetical protein
MSREAVIGPVKRSDLWTFPVVAVREAIMNAIVHADYAQHGAPIRVALFDDRLEVENPGLLPFGLTIEDIQKGISKLRNRAASVEWMLLSLKKSERTFESPCRPYAGARRRRTNGTKLSLAHSPPVPRADFQRPR